MKCARSKLPPLPGMPSYFTQLLPLKPPRSRSSLTPPGTAAGGRLPLLSELPNQGSPRCNRNREGRDRRRLQQAANHEAQHITKQSTHTRQGGAPPCGGEFPKHATRQGRAGRSKTVRQQDMAWHNGAGVEKTWSFPSLRQRDGGQAKKLMRGGR